MYDVDFPIYMDSFNELNFEKVYCPWPERAFIFYEGKIVYIAKAHIEGFFWRSEIQKWFKSNNIISA